MLTDLNSNIAFVLYDIKNLPVRIYFTDNTIADYIYDTEGQRIKTANSSSSVTWNYIHDVNGQTIMRIKNEGSTVAKVIHNLFGNDIIGTNSVTSTSEERNYFLKDHLGSIKVIVNTSGSVVGYDDYDAFGLIMDGRNGGSSDETIKYTGKEYDEETGYYYFGARSYMPLIGRWPVVDPMSEKYPGISNYAYCVNNPMLFVDPNGDSTFVATNKNGTYTVTGGNLSGKEDDTGVYIKNSDGTFKLVGNSLTSLSFFGENNKPVVGAVIDPNSSEGQKFINNEIVQNDPSLVGYMSNATNGGTLDFKTRGIEDKPLTMTSEQYMYRGSTTAGGTFASARDFGNMAAGIVAGRNGLSWNMARFGFDLYQSYKSGYFTVEAKVTQKAQRIGYIYGSALRSLRKY